MKTCFTFLDTSLKSEQNGNGFQAFFDTIASTTQNIQANNNGNPWQTDPLAAPSSGPKKSTNPFL